MNKFERSNLLTMLAILMVLPATKYFVGFIVVFPYKSVSRERYEHIKSLISDNTILFTDMVFTSSDKVMNLDFMIITDNQLIGLLGKKKQDIKYMENYLKETLTVNKIEGYTVKIFDEQKAHELLKELVIKGITINKFEIMKPTLNDIFIEKVGE